MSIIKKCGPFMQDDAGHVVKREGKSFRLPRLPDKMKEPYPTEVYEDFSLLGLIATMSDYFDRDTEIDRRNHKKEKAFQHKIKSELLSLASIYYVTSLKRRYKIIQNSARKKCRSTLAFIGKMQRAYHQYRS